MPESNLTPPTLTTRDAERFWSKIEYTTPDGCWLWTAGRDKDGYGKFHANRRHLRAHRVAVFLMTGVWPELGMHECDNPPCCRVGAGHLRAGTDAENRADMVRKGRGALGMKNARYTHPETTARGDRHGSRLHPESVARGERSGAYTHPERLARGDKNGSRLHPELLKRGSQHPNAKLNENDVRAIRIARAEGETLTALGMRYGVAFSLIDSIVKYRLWRHVR